MNQKLNTLAFLSLIGCLVLVALSLTILSGGWAIAGSVTSALLGILAGGLYGLSVRGKT